MNTQQIRQQRQRIQKKAGGKADGKYLNKRALALEVLRLAEQGKTNREIALIIGRSDRYVRELKSLARVENAAMGLEVPDPKGLDDLDPYYRDMVSPPTVEGFERFFNEFSGRVLPEHTKEWVREALENRRVLLNVPPRHAKSTVMSVWLPMYLVAGNRNVQILIVSQTSDFAVKFCREIAEHFERDNNMIQAFGRFVPQNQSWTWAPNSGALVVEGRTRLILPGDLTIQIRGARQQILGMEADWIIMDDPDNPDIVRSETERNRLREWVDDQVMTRLNPGGHAVCVGQRLHVNDIYGYLKAKKRTRTPGQPAVWEHINYPAVLDWEKHEVLWEDQWPFERLMEERYDDLGQARFECMYQQNPMADFMRLVQPAWIQGSEKHVGCLDVDRPVGFGIPRGFLPVVRVVSWDPSPTEFHGFVVADVVYDTSRFMCSVLHMESERYQAREGLNRIDQLLGMYQPDYLVIEDSAVSKWIFQDPWYNTVKSRVRVLSHRTTAKTKGDEEYGVQSLAVDFEFGRIRLPYGDAEARRMVDRFLEQEAYTYPEGEVDDRLMALWFLKYSHRALIPMGSLVTRWADDDNDAFDTTGFEDAW